MTPRTLLGIALIAAGILVLLLGHIRLPFGGLPGDIAYRGRTFSFYFPVVSCLIISILLSLVWYIISRWRG